jgi:hypothetical protein
MYTALYMLECGVTSLYNAQHRPQPDNKINFKCEPRVFVEIGQSVRLLSQ